jgi:hypothetical protein
MLGLEGVMEMEVSVFEEIPVVGDPQPATDIKAIGRAREMSLTQRCNEFMLAFMKIV